MKLSLLFFFFFFASKSPLGIQKMANHFQLGRLRTWPDFPQVERTGLWARWGGRASTIWKIVEDACSTEG